MTFVEAILEMISVDETPLERQSRSNEAFVSFGREVMDIVDCFSGLFRTPNEKAEAATMVMIMLLVLREHPEVVG